MRMACGSVAILSTSWRSHSLPFRGPPDFAVQILQMTVGEGRRLVIEVRLPRDAAVGSLCPSLIQRSPSHNASASCDRCCLKPIWKPNEGMSKPSYTADKLWCLAGPACTPAAAGSVAANSCIRGNTYYYSRDAEFPELGEFAIVPRIPLLRERRIAAIRAPSTRLAPFAFSMRACYALKRVANVNYKLIKARKDPPI
jgi:hypothetical protein